MSIFVNGKMIDYFNFNGGECHVKLDVSEVTHACKLIAYLHDSDAVMRLLLTVDAIRRINPLAHIELTLPYFPYTRQDRVCNAGEALSIKVMADLINALHCHKVVIYDPHSEVTPALLNCCSVISMADIIEQSTLAQDIVLNQWALVSPDAGAEKKVREVAKCLSSNTINIELFCATKVRDTLTGKILATDVYADVAGKNLIITDDICDGGQTFITLAKALKDRGANNLFLYVSYGIFSQGLTLLQDYFNKIYCYHTRLKPEEFDNTTLIILGKN